MRCVYDQKKLPKIEALLFLAAQTVLDFQFSSKQSLLFFGRHTDSTFFWRAEKDPNSKHTHTRLELSKFSNSIHMEWCGVGNFLIIHCVGVSI